MNKNIVLSLNDSGNDVILLEQLLKNSGYYPLSVTGVFTINTEYYLKKFQIEYNIEATGVTDNNTWEVLYNLNSTPTLYGILDKKTLRIGDEGKEVEELQIILKDLLYYKGDIDSVFGNLLLKAVKSFQFINKLVPDGIVGTNTWSGLLTMYSPLAICDEEDDNETFTYTVKKGDTLYKIANMFNISVNQLKRINNLDSDILNIGQVIKVKDNNINDDYINYVVKSGDTLYKIASTYLVSVPLLKSYNNLDSDILSIGMIIKIPNNSNEPDIDNVYIVKKGDTLYKIANMFSTDIDTLKKINNLSSDVLSIGSTIITKDYSDIIYIVKSGDTLYSIATKYNTTVDLLKTKNNLDSNILRIGQILII